MMKFSIYRVEYGVETWEASFADAQQACVYANTRNLFLTGSYYGSPALDYILKNEES